MIARAMFGVAVAAVSALAFGGVACGGKGAVAPTTATSGTSGPSLSIASLPAIAQGPGARWLLVAHPLAVASGPLGPLVEKVIPSAPGEGLDALAEKLGLDLRKARDFEVAGYEETTFFAVTIPDGTPPDAPLRTLEARFLPPTGHTMPLPGVARIFGSLASGVRVSAAVLPVAATTSSGTSVDAGSILIAERGKFGPLLTSIALAAGKLQKARAIEAQKPFDSLLAWSMHDGSPFVMMARCPLDASAFQSSSTPSGASPTPMITTECDGAAVSVRAGDHGALIVEIHIEGRWERDAAGAGAETRAILERIVASDLGHALGLHDASGPTAKIDVVATTAAIDARLTADAAKAAEGLRALIESDWLRSGK